MPGPRRGRSCYPVVLLTGDADEEVLIDSILAGAWGCLSKQDGGGEQLRLIRRVLNGHTAYSGRFRPALLARFPGSGPMARMRGSLPSRGRK